MRFTFCFFTSSRSNDLTTSLLCITLQELLTVLWSTQTKLTTILDVETVQVRLRCGRRLGSDQTHCHHQGCGQYIHTHNCLQIHLFTTKLTLMLHLLSPRCSNNHCPGAGANVPDTPTQTEDGCPATYQHHARQSPHQLPAAISAYSVFTTK